MIGFLTMRVPRKNPPLATDRRRSRPFARNCATAMRWNSPLKFLGSETGFAWGLFLCVCALRGIVFFSYIVVYLILFVFCVCVFLGVFECLFGLLVCWFVFSVFFQSLRLFLVCLFLVMCAKVSSVCVVFWSVLFFCQFG